MKNAGWLLFAGALLVRLLWAALSHQLWGWSKDTLYDDGKFVDMALSFLGRRDEVWIIHPPGYSAFLAPFLAFCSVETGVSLARLAQLLLSAALAPLTWRLGLRAKLSEREALVAGAFIALSPMMTYFAARVMAETLFTALVAALLLVWLRAWETGRPRDAALAGLLGGLATLTRGVMLPFGGMLALFALLLRRQQPAWLRLLLVCGGVWAAVVAPWSLRNYARFDRFIAVSAQGGWNLYEGLTLDLAEIARRPYEMSAEAEAQGIKGLFETHEYFGRKAKAWIKEHKAEFARMCVVKAGRFWRPWPYPPHSASVRWGVGLFSAALFALGLLGLFSGAARPAGAAFLLAWAFHLTLLHAVFASSLRYRMPVEPVAAVFAGAALRVLVKRDRIAS